MQLIAQTDMFPDIPRGLRYWLVRGSDERLGHWVYASQGEAEPTAYAIETKLGFRPEQITELAEAQALRYAPVKRMKIYDTMKVREVPNGNRR